MYLEGSIISFTELGDAHQGIILEKTKNSSFIVLDIYGNMKTIYKENVISISGVLPINPNPSWLNP